MSTILKNFKVTPPNQEIYEEGEKYYNTIYGEVKFYMDLAAELHPGASKLGPQFNLPPNNNMHAYAHLQTNMDQAALHARQGKVSMFRPIHILEKPAL